MQQSASLPLEMLQQLIGNSGRIHQRFNTLLSDSIKAPPAAEQVTVKEVLTDIMQDILRQLYSSPKALGFCIGYFGSRSRIHGRQAPKGATQVYNTIFAARRDNLAQEAVVPQIKAILQQKIAAQGDNTTHYMKWQRMLSAPAA